MMMNIDVIIPCRNEARTIGPIVRTFKKHPCIRNVFVVIDMDTTDVTAGVAADAGASVILARTKGKGQCVKAGLDYVETKQTILCDGDLTGLTIHHVDELIGAGHIIGIPDFPLDEIIMSGPVVRNPEWFHRIKITWGFVSGERNVPTRLLRGLDLHGYLMEVQINHACIREDTRWVYLEGLHSPFIMTEKRMAEMHRDRQWGIEHGIFKRGVHE